MSQSTVQKQLFAIESERLIPSFEFTIIQCPGCDTRFRVTTDIVNESENPRFHCSRCDLVFNQSEIKPAPKAEIPPTPTVVAVPAEKPVHDFNREVTTYRQPKKSSLQFEIPSTFFRNVTVSAPHEHSPVSEEHPHQLSLKFPKKPQTSLFSKLSMRSIGTNSLNNISASLNPTAAISKAWFMPKTISKWGGTLTIASCVLAFLAILAAGTLLVKSSDGTSSTVASWIVSDAAKPPLPEIQIQNPKFETTILESGDTVHIVSGQVLNAAPLAIKDVQVEAVLFNKTGELIGTQRGYLGSQIVKSRLENLSLDTIKDLQDSSPDVKTSLLPKNKLISGKTGDFRIVIPHSSLNLAADENERGSNALLEPVYFSARVYSAREIKE
jgi:hypothetical protein